MMDSVITEPADNTPPLIVGEIKEEPASIKTQTEQPTKTEETVDPAPVTEEESMTVKPPSEEQPETPADTTAPTEEFVKIDMPNRYKWAEKWFK